MNIDFLANVNKSSGSAIGASGSSGAPASGFLEQMSRAMRDNDRKYEQAVEKNPDDGKKSFASAKPRTSAKTGENTKAGENTNAPKKTDRAGQKNADNEAVAAAAADNTETTSETNSPGRELTGKNSGFHAELEQAEADETESAYAFSPVSDEISKTENDFTFSPAVEETSFPDAFADSSVDFSTDALIFPPALVQNDSGFAVVADIDAGVENDEAAAGLNAAQTEKAAAPPAAEVISQMAAGRQDAAPPPETANVNVAQNASNTGAEAIIGAKELLEEPTVERDPAEAKSTQQADNGTTPENELLQKNQVLAQTADSNASTLLRGEAAQVEIRQEAKSTGNAEIELSLQSTSDASSEKDALLLERLATQTFRPREGSPLASASENAGKTVQVAETSVQAASASVKAEASAPTKSAGLTDQEFIIELAGRIQAQIRGGREMIRIQLHPEDLGRLEIRAESGRNGIIARIAAESLDVKKLLETNLQSLQQTLEARGLKIDRLHIVVEDSAYAAFADAGRYGHAGTGPRNSEVSEFSKSYGAKVESSPEEYTDDLSAEAERRGAGFYTVG
jgi:flagellar hook-length control protein FliK